MPSEKRQPAASATGTATSGGTNAATASSDEYNAVIVPTRSGKYFLMSGGSTTLPTPIAANSTAAPTRSARASDARARPTIAAVATTIEATASRSSPKRRSRAGVTMPKIAKHTGGAAPMRPRIHAGTATATSASTSARIGDSDATAERREKATSTMPVNARSLPRHRERGRASVTRSSLRPACGVEAASPRGRRVPSGGDGLAGGPRGREASSAGRIPSPQRTGRRPSGVDARVSPAAHGADARVSSLASPRPRRGIPRSRCR